MTPQSVNRVLTSLSNSGLCWTIFAWTRDTAVPAEGNGDLQTLICVLVARPRRGLTLSNPVPWQNWMAAYLGYTLQMKMLFRGWPVMVNEMYTRRRRMHSVLWRGSLGIRTCLWPMITATICSGLYGDLTDYWLIWLWKTAVDVVLCVSSCVVCCVVWWNRTKKSALCFCGSLPSCSLVTDHVWQSFVIILNLLSRFTRSLFSLSFVLLWDTFYVAVLNTDTP